MLTLFDSSDDQRPKTKPLDSRLTNVQPEPVQPKPIHVPTLKDFPPPVPRSSAGEARWETFEQDSDTRNQYDPIMTAAETEKALKDLVSGAIGADEEVNINEEEMTVPGFHEEIKLLPHQVIGRRWMRARETGNKYGGILADDMGFVFLTIQY